MPNGLEPLVVRQGMDENPAELRFQKACMVRKLDCKLGGCVPEEDNAAGNASVLSNNAGHQHESDAPLRLFPL